MAVPSVFDIRDELRNALSGVFGQRAYGWVDQPQPPCALVSLDSADYEVTFAGDHAAYNFDVLVVVTFGPTLEDAMQALDRYLSPFGDDSVVAALLADPTLGGLVDTLFVHGMKDYGQMKINGAEYFGAAVQVEVRI